MATDVRSKSSDGIHSHLQSRIIDGISSIDLCSSPYIVQSAPVPIDVRQSPSVDYEESFRDRAQDYAAIMHAHAAHQLRNPTGTIPSYKTAMRSWTIRQIRKSGIRGVASMECKTGACGLNKPSLSARTTESKVGWKKAEVEKSPRGGSVGGSGHSAEDVDVQEDEMGVEAVSLGRVAVEDLVRKLSVDQARETVTATPIALSNTTRKRHSHSEESSPHPAVRRLDLATRLKGDVDCGMLGDIADEELGNPCNTPKAKSMSRANTVAATRKGKTLGKMVTQPLVGSERRRVGEVTHVGDNSITAECR